MKNLIIDTFYEDGKWITTIDHATVKEGTCYKENPNKYMQGVCEEYPTEEQAKADIQNLVDFFWKTNPWFHEDYKDLSWF